MVWEMGYKTLARGILASRAVSLLGDQLGLRKYDTGTRCLRVAFLQVARSCCWSKKE